MGASVKDPVFSFVFHVVRITPILLLLWLRPVSAWHWFPAVAWLLLYLLLRRASNHVVLRGIMALLGVVVFIAYIHSGILLVVYSVWFFMWKAGVYDWFAQDLGWSSDTRGDFAFVLSLPAFVGAFVSLSKDALFLMSVIALSVALRDATRLPDRQTKR